VRAQPELLQCLRAVVALPPGECEALPFGRAPRIDWEFPMSRPFSPIH
jgi:hypothetical protein